MNGYEVVSTMLMLLQTIRWFEGRTLKSYSQLPHESISREGNGICPYLVTSPKVASGVIVINHGTLSQVIAVAWWSAS